MIGAVGESTTAGLSSYGVTNSVGVPAGSSFALGAGRMGGMGGGGGGGYGGFSTAPEGETPEPASVALWIIGLALLVGHRWYRRRRA